MAKTNSKEQDQDNMRSAKHVNVVKRVCAVVALVMGLGCIAFLEFLVIWGPTDGNRNWSDFAATLLPTVTVIVGIGYVIYITREANIKIRRFEIRTINESRESQQEECRKITEAWSEWRQREAKAWSEWRQREAKAWSELRQREAKAWSELRQREANAWKESRQRQAKAWNESLEKHNPKVRNDFQKQAKRVTAKHARPAGDVQDTMTDKN